MAVRWIVAIVFMLGLLTACGGGATDSDAGAGGASSATQPGEAAEDQNSNAELRIGSGFLPATLDPVQDGYSMIQFGIGETLTRVLPDQQVEPWLAESVTSADGLTWSITLRENATFWDGTPVDAAAVERSIRRSLETIPAAPQFLDPAVEIAVVDARKLELQFTEPVPTLLNSLAAFQFMIAAEDPDALGGFQMTGLYRPVEHTPDDNMRIEAYTGHWSGSPPFGQISVRLIKDANARMLGLQSGEIDLMTEVPPELASGVGAGVEILSGPSTRIHHVVLNHAQLPFSDPAVREAFAIAIDRDVLNTLTVAGLGTTTSSIFPADVGLPVIDEIETDLARAAELLDTAGWVMGADNVRQKDGQKLSFVLHTYARRPELPPIAVSIQDQLKGLGFAIEVQQVEDIVAQMEGGEFDASMFSVNLVPIGDPRYAFNVTLVEGGTYNYGGYRNERLEEIVMALQTEADPTMREALIVEAQEIVRAETANVYLLAAPRVVAYREDTVAPFTLHPNDLYMIDTSVAPR